MCYIKVDLIFSGYLFTYNKFSFQLYREKNDWAKTRTAKLYIENVAVLLEQDKINHIASAPTPPSPPRYPLGSAGFIGAVFSGVGGGRPACELSAKDTDFPQRARGRVWIRNIYSMLGFTFLKLAKFNENMLSRRLSRMVTLSMSFFFCH